VYGVQMVWEMTTAVSMARVGTHGKVTLCPLTVGVFVLLEGEERTGHASAMENPAPCELSQTVVGHFVYVRYTQLMSAYYATDRQLPSVNQLLLPSVLLPSVLLTLLVWRQEGHPACKKWGDGGGGHWLVRMEWRPAVWCVSASVNLPLHHKVQKFSSGTGSPGWSWKKGRAVKRMCVRATGRVDW